MTNWITLRFWFAALAALILAMSVRSANNAHKKKRLVNLENVTPRYQPFPYLLWLPSYLIFYYILESMDNGTDTETTNRRIFTVCFMLFLHMTVYYAVLLPLLPYLRRHFSAFTCAQLWVLPGVLYIFVYTITAEALQTVAHPLLAIHLPETLAAVLWKVWLTGFLTFLLWKIHAHLRFRNRIEDSARKVTDPEVLQVWEQEQKKLGEFPLLESVPFYSPLICTPLSIGVFKSTTILVLPEKEYTPENLELIFQHEIIHIQRRDGAAKFFLTFCTAMCWFNPLMWKAMRRCAEDLELSCDEAVLNEYLSEETLHSKRHQYAQLILQSAGDERGFTTCLSATASSLRYRLQNIIHPRSRKSGALLIALITFCLIMSFGFVTLSY